MKELHCVIIGDANIDVITSLERQDVLHMENPCVYSGVTTSVGGNGIFFAEAAREAGYTSVKLLCSLGEDLAAEEIRAYCQRKKLDIIHFPSKKNTGKVIILYKPNDKRILIADRGANEDFLIGGDDLPTRMFHTTNILYVSGYFLLNETQSLAVECLANKFINAGSFAVIDVVPHDIYERMSWNEYYKRCAYAHGVIAEAPTIAGFMKADAGCMSADEMADFLLRSFGFCIIRLNALSDFLIADRNQRTIIRIDYRQQMSSLRFSDRVAAYVLKQYLNDPKGFFASPAWADDVKRAMGERA